jgi:hypothetical protein
MELVVVAGTLEDVVVVVVGTLDVAIVIAGKMYYCTVICLIWFDIHFIVFNG